MAPHRVMGVAGQPGGGWGRDAVAAAVRQRRDEVAEALRDWGPSGIRGMLVELDYIKGPGDPKAALRLGLAGAGMVSQFIQPPQPKESVEQRTHRATSAVRDLLRQLGVLPDRPNPSFQGATLPPLSILGLTTITKRTGRRGRGGFGKTQLPVLVQLHTDDTRIRVYYPGSGGWLTYPQAAVELAGRVEQEGWDNQALNRWLEDTLLSDILPEGEALLLVDGYRTRSWWGWLANKALTMDRLQFGEAGRLRAPVHDPLWSRLRVVRLRPGDSGETAQWFGQDGERVGTPKGLYQLSERTFLSSQERPASAKKSLKVGDSKRERPGKDGWLPRLMEATVVLNGSGEDPAQWAAVAHHLRAMLPHHDEAAILPLPLHLAMGLGEYLLPLTNDEDEAN